MSEIHKLDNPVWHSLNESHQAFALNYEQSKFYQPDYCPFGGLVNPEKAEDEIAQYGERTSRFFTVGEQPILNNKVQLIQPIVCNQMVLDSPIRMELKEEMLVLEPRHFPALIALVNLVQPGYFRNRTPELGTYFGIFKDDMLVAVTGERMKMNAFTEVSAVVTHPDYTGRGYAKELIVQTTNKIFAAQKTPYLHVAASNVHAIRIYEKLGFVSRRKMSFWNLQFRGGE